jgi:hypothetical protein
MNTNIFFAEFVDFDATCRTDGCGNGNITIRIKAHPDNINIICGVCAIKITDVVGA